MSNQDLKEQVLRISKGTLSIVPFSTIDSYLNTTFDMALDNPSSEEEIDSFLRNTKLSQLDYLDIDNNKLFTLKNRTNGSTIYASNRPPAFGELRGPLLRELLDNQKLKNPDQSVYDAITVGIRSAEHSDLVRGIKRAVSVGEIAKRNFSTPMSEPHFDLFTRVCLWQIQNKQLKDINAMDIPRENELEALIWEGINMDLIYDTTEAITVFIEEIKKKSDELQTRGYSEAATAALDLHEGLTQACKQLFEGKQSVPSFSKNCQALIQTAENSELKEHRGFWGTMLHGIHVLFNVITFGAVPVTQTNSVAKLKEINSALQKREVLPPLDDEGDLALHP